MDALLSGLVTVVALSALILSFFRVALSPRFKGRTRRIINELFEP